MSNKEAGSILIIDDDITICSLIALAMRRAFSEFIIRTASGGEEGIELARLHKPDIILLDIMMPNLIGYEVCRIIKGDVETKGVFVVMFTALTSKDSHTRALEAGADEYLTKPTTPAKLEECIQNIIRGKRLGLYSE